MRAKMLLFALSALAGFGQDANLVGLPEYGVTLSGTPDNPVMENHSSQTIIGHVFRVYFTNGNLPINFANLKVRDIWEGRKGLEPNQTETPLMKFFAVPKPSVRLQVQGQVMEAPVKVVLDSVVFANGQVVGPDVVQNFPMLTEQVAALRELATFALEAQQNSSLQPTLWSELDRLTARQGLSQDDRAKLALAFDLRAARVHNHDEEVFAMADRLLAIPTPWRAK
jgi:hypothetical protein